jgi:hypothetical protein
MKKKLAAALVTVTMATGLSVVGAATQASARPTVATIGTGSTNVHGVWCVQRILNRNYPEAGISETGTYGSKTTSWVQRFRQDNGLGTGTTVNKATGNSLLASVGGDQYCWQYLPTTY